MNFEQIRDFIIMMNKDERDYLKRMIQDGELEDLINTINAEEEKDAKYSVYDEDEF